MTLFRWLLNPEISTAEIRAEIFLLGGRHRGEPLAGALEELKTPGLSGGRADLLRAVVRSLRADRS